MAHSLPLVLPRIGLSVVLTPGERGKPRPYSESYARRIVREARRRAGLPEHVTLTACRHGGMTELGDAEVAEQQVMALGLDRLRDEHSARSRRGETFALDVKAMAQAIRFLDCTTAACKYLRGQSDTKVPAHGDSPYRWGLSEIQ